MGFDIYHSPTAKSLGLNALAAGLGQYNLKQQARRDAINAQKRSIRARRESQESAQQARTRDYAALRNFQADQAEQEQQARLERDRLKYGMQGQMEARELQAEQAQKTKDFVNRGWSEFQGKIDNWQDFNPQQKREWEKIENDMSSVLADPALTDTEKELAVKQGIIKGQAILRSVVPKQKTRQDKLIEQGRAPGDMFMEDGRLFVVDDKWVPKPIDRRDPKETRIETALKLMEMHNKDNKDKITLQDALKKYDEGVLPQNQSGADGGAVDPGAQAPSPVDPQEVAMQAEQAALANPRYPEAARFLVMNGSDPANLPPEMLSEFNDALLSAKEAEKKTQDRSVEKKKKIAKKVNTHNDISEEDAAKVLDSLSFFAKNMLTVEQIKNMTKAQRERIIEQFSSNK